MHGRGLNTRKQWLGALLTLQKKMQTMDVADLAAADAIEESKDTSMALTASAKQHEAETRKKKWSEQTRDLNLQLITTQMIATGTPPTKAAASALAFMTRSSKTDIKLAAQQARSNIVYVPIIIDDHDDGEYDCDITLRDDTTSGSTTRYFAMTTKAFEAWKAPAEKREVSQLTNMGVFGRTLARPPAGTPKENIIRGFFVYNPTKKKARLVMADTQRQLPKSVKTTPTAAQLSLPAILIYAVANGWELDVADVTAAYLTQDRRPDDEAMFLRINGSHGYREIKKACYGLQESGRIWYDAFYKILRDLGFKPTTTDTEVMTNSVKKCLLLKHVDDTLSASPPTNDGTLNTGQRTVAEICKVHPMRMSDGTLFLGLDIDYDQKKGILKLFARTAIMRMSEKFLTTTDIRYVQVLLPIVLLASDRLTAPDDVFYLSWDH
jgi:hypothetical protein